MQTIAVCIQPFLSLSFCSNHANLKLQVEPQEQPLRDEWKTQRFGCHRVRVSCPPSGWIFENRAWSLPDFETRLWVR